MNAIRIVLAVVALTWAVAGAASATPTLYSYSGQITDIRDFNGSGVQNIISYGTTFSGTLFYDPAAPFAYMIEPDRALFQGPLGPSTATAGAIHVTGNSAEVQLFDNYNGMDMVFLPSLDYDISDLPLGLEGYVGVIRVQLYGPVNNMTLPETLDTGLFYGTFGITGYSTSAEPPSYFSWHVGGTIDSLTRVQESAPVPEPSTILLLGGGIAGLAFWRRRNTV